MAAAAILNIGKMSITLDWIEISCIKLYGKMHHGHAEMTTWPKVETESQFAWRHQMKFWSTCASISVTTLCSKKTCDHVFDDKLKWNCPFTKIFGTLITKTIGHRHMFLFSHLTYLVQLLYLGKLSRPKYHQKNKQNHENFTGRCEGPCAQSGGQAKKASVSSLDFARTCHSLFKCIQKNNSPWSPAHMLQMMSCSAVVWSQSYIPSHSLINNVIVCNKSCYCSIINRKLYNK